MLSHLPSHEIYVEPFGGSAAVLLQKPRSRLEIYNDLDGEIVNLFRVVRDDAMRVQLIDALNATPSVTRSSTAKGDTASRRCVCRTVSRLSASRASLTGFARTPEKRRFSYRRRVTCGGWFGAAAQPPALGLVSITVRKSPSGSKRQKRRSPHGSNTRSLSASIRPQIRAARAARAHARALRTMYPTGWPTTTRPMPRRTCNLTIREPYERQLSRSARHVDRMSRVRREDRGASF
ncbi:DNA adenine methylase [Burkholderia plantarii]|uniref:DNA adenine methylase n=1 Tax=Burkholderia plantarii TaxID=41899 RepID=UPI00209A7ECB|nr:DNA adenine methylase [Burkholderia plantarii]